MGHTGYWAIFRHFARYAFVALLGLGLVLGLGGCDSAPEPPGEPTAAAPVEAPAPDVAARRLDGRDLGGRDLDAIQARGVLRLVAPANVEGRSFLPRAGSPVDGQYEAAEAFARAQGLEPVLVPVSAFKDMIPTLEREGDLLVANLTVTEARRKRIAFSVPITHVREQVLVRADETGITKAADLVGKRVMADPASSFWPRLQRLAAKYPGIQLTPRPEGMDDESELEGLASGAVDALARDSNVVEMYSSYRDDVKAAFDLSGTRDIAWGLRKDAPKLQAAVNEFLHFEQVADPHDAIHLEDLDAIKERRRLRVLLRNNAASYFLYRGELLGFEYEMTRAFAKALGVRLQVVVPPTHEDMFAWLLAGRADMAVGFLEPLQSRRDAGAAFTRPYHYAPVHLVARERDAITRLEDLRTRTITVRRSSSYWALLEELAAAGHGFELEAAPEDMETEELIHRVMTEQTDLTVADGQILEVELAQGAAVRSALILAEKRPHAVAVRQGNPQLLAALNDFIKKQYRGVAYNLLYKKYFRNKRSIARLARGRVDTRADGSLSPYDPIVRKYAEQYGFDWRMLVAQMYQESRFDPKAESFAGARGLMQVMPRTAKSLGFEDLAHPESGIHAGVKYMDWVRDRIGGELPVATRTWFTLAAYNAGAGHVHDARRLAKQMGWNADLWFEHTEKAMLLLAKKPYASKARYGYVRGREPVNYVRNIRERFEAYVKLTEGRLAADSARAGD